MFSKLFSSKTVPSDTKQTILSHLEHYTSESFPKGILFPDIVPEYILDKANQIVIKFSLPFPCIGEIEQLAEVLSEHIKQTVRFDINFNIKVEMN